MNRLLKALVLVVLALVAAREFAFRRNLRDFDPATAPYGE